MFVFSGLFKWIGIGIDFTVLSFSILMIAGVKKISLKALRPMGIPMFLLFCLFFLALLSVIYTPASPEVFQKKLIGLSLGVLAILFPVLHPSYFSSSKTITKAINFIAIPVIIFVFLELLVNGYQRIILSPPVNFPGYLALGSFLSLGILSISFIPNKLLKIPLMIIGFFALIALGGRGPVIFLVVVLLLKYFRIKSLRSVSSLILLVVLMIIGFNFVIDLPVFIRFVSRIGLLMESFGQDSTGRISHFSHSLEIIQDFPFFGIGIGGYGSSFYGYDVFSYPHNFILEIGSELGGIALILFLAFCFYFLSFYRRLEVNSGKVVLGYFFLLFFLNGMKSGGLENFRVVLCWMGILFAFWFMNKRKTI